MSHGGASGSPVFFPDSGRVAGVLYGGLVDPQDAGTVLPTNISFAVPGHYLHVMLEIASTHDAITSETGALSLEEMLVGYEKVNMMEGSRRHQEGPRGSEQRQCIEVVTLGSSASVDAPSQPADSTDYASRRR
jgi:hypothetical protein